MLGGVKPGNAGYGLYGGFGEGRAWADAAWELLKIPSAVTKAAFTSVDLSQRIGPSLSIDAGNVLLFRSFARRWRTQFGGLLLKFYALSTLISHPKETQKIPYW